MQTVNVGKFAITAHSWVDVPHWQSEGIFIASWQLVEVRDINSGELIRRDEVRKWVDWSNPSRIHHIDSVSA